MREFYIHARERIIFKNYLQWENSQLALYPIKTRIKKEVNGKTISLMFGVCTIATLSTLGVSATYMAKEKVVCRSLDIIKIEKCHTAVYLWKRAYI